MLHPRLTVIEFMRGVAAISVALFHFSGQLTTPVPAILHAYGWLGVDVFFIISGFVIPYSLAERGYQLRHFPRFMARRLIRLEPAYLASIGLSIALWHASSLAPGFHGTAPQYSLPQIVSHFLYLIPLTNFDWLNPVYWTLAYEFMFYIIVGLAFPVLINRPLEWTLLLTTIVSATLYSFTGQLDVRIIEFLIGALLMRAHVEKQWRNRTGLWLLIVIGLIFARGGYSTGIAISCSVMLIYLGQNIKLSPWCGFLGSFSYSLYLTHVTVGGRVINLGVRFGHGPLFEFCLLMIALATSLLFAFFFCRLFEIPALQVSRRAVLVPT